MRWPFVGREHFDDVRADLNLRIAQLELQNKELQARYDELRKHADALAMAGAQENREPPEEHMGPMIRDIRSFATERKRDEYAQRVGQNK